jgi:hypothetical protein
LANSAIDTILSNLAALAPTPSSDTVVRVETMAQVRDTLDEADLPVRRFEPIGGTEAAVEWIALGSTVEVAWKIRDIFYFRIAGQGQGWQSWSNELKEYMESYINTIRTNRAIVSQGKIVNVTMTPGVFAFPEGTDHHFAGVAVVLEIHEYIS